MRILHTSDWHIGRSLYRKRRHEEMRKFLTWLEEVIAQEGVDALLVAGDVFDSATPSNESQELYYRFLQRIACSSCRHVVITAGNHDSPTFLDAPARLLGLLNIHVVGGAKEPSEEVLTLRDEDGRSEAIVCAVPYLRDRDVRAARAGEDFQERQRALVEGIAAHYAAVLEIARERREEGIPLFLMGHLFATGGAVLEGDGVRELYVGALVQLEAGLFPSDVSYTALGHLHVPQAVAGRETVRYSGSPLPMSFGEAHQQKSVCLADVEGSSTSVRLLPVPRFQRLERVRGDWNTIQARLLELRFAGDPVWLEVSYEGREPAGDLWGRLRSCLEDCPDLELLCVRDEAKVRRAAGPFMEMGRAGLESLSPLDVFERLLDVHEVEHREDLRLTYQEALSSVQEALGEGVS